MLLVNMQADVWMRLQVNLQNNRLGVYLTYWIASSEKLSGGKKYVFSGVTNSLNLK